MKVWWSLRPALSVKRGDYPVLQRHSICAGAKEILPPWPQTDWGTHRGDPFPPGQLVIQHGLGTTETPSGSHSGREPSFWRQWSKIKNNNHITVPWGFALRVSRGDFVRNLGREDTAPEAGMWALLCSTTWDKSPLSSHQSPEGSGPC